MRRTPCVLLGICWFVSAVATSSPARGDESAVAAAESLFAEGRALLDKGQFEEACDRFSRSQQLDPAVGTLLNLGECYEKQNKTASAWGAYRQAVTLAATRKDEKRAAIAREAAERLEPHLSRLTIEAASKPPGLVVTRNGTRIEIAALDTPIPVDPGEQVITASAPDREEWRTTVELGDGESLTVRIPELPVIPKPDTGIDIMPVQPPATVTNARKAALGLFVGGGVAVAAGLVFGGLAFSTWASVTEVCPDGTCPTEADRAKVQSDREASSTYATVSTLAIGAGAAAIAAGAIVHFTSGNKRVSVAPAPTRGGFGVTTTFGL